MQPDIDNIKPVFCGNHKVYIDEQIMIVHFLGDFKMSDWIQMKVLAEQIINEHKGVYIIGHMGQSRSMDYDLRKEAVQWMAQGWLLGFANVNAGFFGRAIAVMLNNALRIVYKRQNPTGFFKTEEEAREWIAKLQQGAKTRSGE